MNLHCLSFFQSKISKSCHFHGSFMALSHTSLTWVQSAKIYWKKLSKKSVVVVDLFFCLISASFLAICQIHVGFMALSWRFLPSDFDCFSKQFHGTCMSDSWQIHRGFIADSCQFLSIPKNQNHVRFMSLSWQFHGSFMALSHTSLTWVQSAKIYWKSYPKSRCWLSIWFFCLISASFWAICQIHVGFMALSWRFLPSDFDCFSKQFHGTCMSDSWQIHRGFIADSCQFLSIPKNQNHVRFMSLSWQFHGSFMALSHTSLTWVQSAKIYWKKLSKKSVVVVDLVFFAQFQLHFWQYVRFM